MGLAPYVVYGVKHIDAVPLVLVCRRQRDQVAQTFLDTQEQWHQPSVLVAEAEVAVAAAGEGAYTICASPDAGELALVVNEASSGVSSYVIKVAASKSRPGKVKYIFQGKHRSSLHTLLGNLKSTPVRGRFGAKIMLGVPCESHLDLSRAPY